MPPPPLKWQPEQFISPNNCLPSAIACLFPSKRWPIGSGGGGAAPPGKSPLTDTALGPRSAAGGAASFCANAPSAMTVDRARTAIGRRRRLAASRSGFRQGENIECPSGRGFGLEIRHDAGETECGGRIAWIEVAGNDGAGPAAN